MPVTIDTHYWDSLCPLITIQINYNTSCLWGSSKQLYISRTSPSRALLMFNIWFYKGSMLGSNICLLYLSVNWNAGRLKFTWWQFFGVAPILHFPHLHHTQIYTNLFLQILHASNYFKWIPLSTLVSSKKTMPL